MRNLAYLVPVANHFGLTVDGELVAEYSRARDARRGATRRGFILVE